jgi:ATP/maltotriose-dependent transcriptional regulator MalT
MIQLLQQSRHRYASQLLGATVAEERVAQKATARTLSASHLEEPLNAREIQVLRLFAAGLTNAEVAREMFLSVNTVKWYAKNIYSKLNVNRRAQAVARARELRVIP